MGYKETSLASIELASEIIDYKPIVDFSSGLEENMRWFELNWDKIQLLADFPPGMSSAVRKDKTLIEKNPIYPWDKTWSDKTSPSYKNF